MSLYDKRQQWNILGFFKKGMMNVNRNTLSGLFAIVLWSTTVGFARSIAEQIGPLTAGAAVYLTGGVLATGHVLIKKNSFKKLKGLSRHYLFGCGALFVLYSAALFLALGLAKDRHQTLEIGLINYLWPSLTILFSLFILSRKANLWLIPGTLLALSGVFLVMSQGEHFSITLLFTHIQNNPGAYGFGFIAAFSWAIYSNLSRLTGSPDGAGAVPLFILLTGFILLFLQFFFPEQSNFSLGVVIEIIIMGLATALAYIFWDNAMRKGDLILVVSISYLTPFLSTVFSSVYLGIFPGINLWTGCVLIIAGSFLSWRSIDSRDI